jgi:hypothetical protein
MQLPGLSFAKSYGATGYWRQSWLGFDGVTRFKNELDGPLRDQMLVTIPVMLAEMSAPSSSEPTFGAGNVPFIFHIGSRNVVNCLPTPTVTVQGSQHTSSTSHAYSLTTETFSTISNTNPITIMAFVKVNASNVNAEQVIMGLYGTTTSQTFVELYMTHDGTGHRPALRWGTPASVVGTIDDSFNGTQPTDNYCSNAAYLGEYDYVHVAAVIRGTDAKLYVNGQLQSTSDVSISQTMGARTIAIGARRINTTVTLGAQATLTHAAVYKAAMTRSQIAAIASCGLRMKDCRMQSDAQVVPFPSPFDRQAQGSLVNSNDMFTRYPKQNCGVFCYEVREDGSRGFTVVMQLDKINVAAMTVGQKHTLFDMLQNAGGTGGAGPGSTFVTYSFGGVYLNKVSANTVYLEARWGSDGGGTAQNSVLLNTTSNVTMNSRGHIAVVFGANSSSTNRLEIYVDGVLKHSHPIQSSPSTGLGSYNVIVPSWHEPIGLSRTESSEGSVDLRPRVTSGPFAFFPVRLTGGQVNKLYRVWKGIRGNRHRFNHRLPRRYFQYHGPTRQV